MLNNFFRINLPYGIARNENNEWVAFNREYMPLGYNNYDYKKGHIADSYLDKPIYTEYTGITEKFLIDLAFHSEKGIIRNDIGEIIQIFFYDDSTNPIIQNKEEFWEIYFEKLKKVSKLKRKS